MIFTILVGAWMFGCSTTDPRIRDGNELQRGTNDVKRELAKCEDEWAQVDVTNDRSVFPRLIAPDFVSTSSRNGVFRADRQQWLDAWEYEGVKNATNVDVTVHVYAENVAVVTGINTTSGTDSDGKVWTHQDRFTDTWVKRHNKWQCVAAHVTRIK